MNSRRLSDGDNVSVLELQVEDLGVCRCCFESVRVTVRGYGLNPARVISRVLELGAQPYRDSHALAGLRPGEQTATEVLRSDRRPNKYLRMGIWSTTTTVVGGASGLSSSG